MPRPDEQPDREGRFDNEIVVDAYDATERAMSWHGYLEERLRFPFNAKCSLRRATSPLTLDEEVEVLGMADLAECHYEMFVTIAWQPSDLAVPLVQLRPVAGDEETLEAVEDWQYWVARGNEF